MSESSSYRIKEYYALFHSMIFKLNLENETKNLEIDELYRNYHNGLFVELCWRPEKTWKQRRKQIQLD